MINEKKVFTCIRCYHKHYTDEQLSRLSGTHLIAMMHPLDREDYQREKGYFA